MFNANGKADCIGQDARFGKFSSVELRMRGGGRVDDQRFGIRHVCQQRKNLQLVDECSGLCRAALDLKGENGAAPLGKIALIQGMARAVGQAGMVNPVNLGMFGKLGI